jgi:hypothetical protein
MLLGKWAVEMRRRLLAAVNLEFYYQSVSFVDLIIR